MKNFFKIMGIEMDNNNPESGEGFYCSDCGKDVNPEDKICPYCGAAFDNQQRQLSDNDLDQVNQFSKDFYFETTRRHPEWDKYSKVESFGMGPFVTIEIPSPVPGVFPIEITSQEDVPEEITIRFGPADRHMRWRTPPERQTLDGQIEGFEEIIQGIFNEDLIAIQKKPGIFFVTEGLVPLEEYKKMLDKGTLRRAVSWKGTYNYPTDGTHSNWNP
jgi:hypothetical protein